MGAYQDIKTASCCFFLQNPIYGKGREGRPKEVWIELLEQASSLRYAFQAYIFLQ